VQSQITKNILQTIIYYDILNFPLTSFETWKYLLAENSCTLGEVVEALESDDLKNSIEEFRGFYFLKGRKDLVERRIQCDKNSAVKFEIAEKAARWLRYTPFVKMLAVTGTLAMKNCEKDSDIDFFVVLEKGRIFTGRLLVTLIVHLIGRRRHGRKIKNRICLNYFITDESLEVQRQDLFAANEYCFIYTLLGHNVFQKFCRTNLEWIKKLKPNWQVSDLKPARYFVEHGGLSSFIQKSFESLINILWGDRIEAWQKRCQIARIEGNPLTQKPGAYIEYTDQNLIFLPVPQGVRIEEEWQRRIKNIVA
jgi:predicted nucleotidyltransferase